MPGELIEDFRRGLDARKFKLTAPAGTLTTAQNVHITPGAEIEKRKAFTTPALLPNCFGLEVTSAGFLTFGSNAIAFTATQIESVDGVGATFDVGFGFAVPVGTVVTVGTNDQDLAGPQTVVASTANSVTVQNLAASGDGVYAEPGLAVSVLSFPGPTGDAVVTIGYQRLQHPDGVTALTGIKHSTVFEGRAFVVAQFGGDVFAFYDGMLVADFIGGVVKSWLTTNTLLAGSLSALLNTLGSFSSSSLVNVATVTSPAGINTTLEVQTNSATGTLLATNTVTQVDGLDGAAARGQFAIKAGNEANPFMAGQNAVTTVAVGSANILTAPVDWVTSNEATAAAVKDAINTRQTAGIATASRARAGGTAVLHIGVNDFVIGDKVTIAGLTNVVGGDYNAVGVTLTGVAGGNIEYANAGADEAGVADVGGTVTMVARWIGATVDPLNANTVILTVNTEGTIFNGRNIAVTATGNVCIGNFSFAITLASDATTVTTVKYVFVNGVDQLGGSVTGVDLETVAVNVAAAIIASGNYLAAAVGNLVYLSRKLTSSSDTALAVIVVVDAGGGVITTPNDTLVLTLGPEHATLTSGFVSSNPQNITNFTSGLHLSAQVAGGTVPYAFKWTLPPTTKYSDQKFSGAVGLGVKVEFLPTDTEAAPQLKLTRLSQVTQNVGNNYLGYVSCEVTDADGRKISADLQLRVSFYPYT